MIPGLKAKEDKNHLPFIKTFLLTICGPSEAQKMVATKTTTDLSLLYNGWTIQY